jgi:shikimate kinase
VGSESDRSEPFASILLVGFMAAGKSEVARLLSAELSWPAFDVDALLEEREGMPVRDLFAIRGEDWFRREEAALTDRLLRQRQVIVAPGGGWAAGPGRLAAVPSHVLSVWLRVSAEEAVRRAGPAPTDRPLMADRAGMEELLGRREPHYRRARLHLDTEAASAMEVARRIIDHLAAR